MLLTKWDKHKMLHPHKPFARETNTKLEAHLFASYKSNLQSKH
jgi:hypothetical protein